jgi:hypothetical protein
MQHLASPPAEGTRTEQYRLADVAFYPLGNQRLLAYAKGTEATRVLHAEFVNLLSQCREFKPLDEHLHTYGQGRQLSDTAIQTIRGELQRLAQDGFLTSTHQIRNLFQQASRPVSPSLITSIVFPTGNRVDGLQRCMAGYLEHCQHFGRTPDFVVADDSPSSSTREAYRQMLHTMKVHYGFNIAYAGLEEKITFARHLSKVGNIPEEIVLAACVSDKQYGVSTGGANRNTLLLHTIGERILSSDDDIICRVAASPGLKKGIALSSKGNPSEIWFYPDRDSALKANQFVEQDILALHEQWLGQDPKTCGSYGSNDNPISLNRAEPALLQRLATQSGKVAMTVHGTLGDCSWDTTDFFLYQEGESFNRLTSSEQAYQMARASREMAQVTNQVTIVENTALFSMCIGLDNRELLPPFGHLGRPDDATFASTLTKCFSNAYTVYLPWTVIHAPLGTRSYPPLYFDVPFYELLPACIHLFDPGLASTPDNRMYKLGLYLEEIGHLPKTSLTRFIRELLWQQRGVLVSLLEERLHMNQEPLLASWRQDAEAFCTGVRRSALLPIEQLLRGDAEYLQHMLIQFAQILKWWPQIVATAKYLREDGYRLAQPL